MWVNYTEKISIKLQLLQQSVNYNNYSYCNNVNQNTKLQLHKSEPDIMAAGTCTFINFIHNKMVNDYLAIEVIKWNHYKADFVVKPKPIYT